MKTHKVGQLNFGKFETEICVSENVRKVLKSDKISESILIPVAWNWYDSELFGVIDENGDGKPDEKFGKSFRIIYFSVGESFKEFEKDALLVEKTNIKGINLKYIGIKN